MFLYPADSVSIFRYLDTSVAVIGFASESRNRTGEDDAGRSFKYLLKHLTGQMVELLYFCSEIVVRLALNLLDGIVICRRDPITLHPSSLIV